jgi:DNA replicative helicase MCM subunit Mcm2 (Cdc46/Mcm family)
VQALLLVLVGGVTKEMDDGMKLRGDIHACLMGMQMRVVPACCQHN